MTRSIVIKLYSRETEVDSLTTTIKDYCNTILSDSSYTDSHDFIKSLVTLGRYNQEYFNVDTGNLVDSILSTPIDLFTIDIHEDYIQTLKYKVNSGSINGLNTPTRNYSHGEHMIEYTYFVLESGLSIDDLTFTRDGNSITPEPNNNRYQLVSQIDYANLGNEFRTVVTKGNERFITISSPLAYLLNMVNNTSKTAAFRALCRSEIYYYFELNNYYFN